MLLVRITLFATAFALLLAQPGNVHACSCKAQLPHAMGENGNIPENATALFLNLPKRGDFRVEAWVTRNGERSACRSSLANTSIEYLKQLNLQCSLRASTQLDVEFSNTRDALHTSHFSISPKAALPASWGTLRANNAKSMKVRVAAPASCQQVVKATGNTLSLDWSPAAKAWSHVAVFVPLVDGQPFASQNHSLCDDHLAYLTPVGTAHTHLFATEHAMEQLAEQSSSNVLSKRQVAIRVLIPGQQHQDIEGPAVTLPRRLSGAPVEAESTGTGSTEAHAQKVAQVIERCQGKETGAAVVKVKVAGLNGQVLSTQVRAATTNVAACIRKKVQALRFEARGGGRDYEFSVER